jgi:hypothetical protein
MGTVLAENTAACFRVSKICQANLTRTYVCIGFVSTRFNYVTSFYGYSRRSENVVQNLPADLTMGFLEVHVTNNIFCIRI